MADNNFKDDFFGERYHEKKGKKWQFFAKYVDQRFLPHVKIPTEYIIVIAIGVLILLILAYAVGVEKGKRIQIAQAAKTATVETQDLDDKEVATISKTGKDIKVTGQEKPATSEPARPLEEKKEEEKKPASEPADSIYTIQLASFKNLTSAKREVEKLKKRGLNASMEKRGSWYQVYAAGYRDMEEASKAKKDFMRDYEDCYIRKAE